MKIKTYENLKADPAKRWEAYIIDGPWYSGSDPEGYGATEQEAKEKALTQLKQWQIEITEFLDEQAKGE